MLQSSLLRCLGVGARAVLTCALVAPSPNILGAKSRLLAIFFRKTLVAPWEVGDTTHDRTPFSKIRPQRHRGAKQQT